MTPPKVSTASSFRRRKSIDAAALAELEELVISARGLNYAFARTVARAQEITGDDEANGHTFDMLANGDLLSDRPVTATKLLERLGISIRLTKSRRSTASRNSSTSASRGSRVKGQGSRGAK